MSRIQDETYWTDVVHAFPILHDGIEKLESCDDDKFFSIKNMIIEEKIRNTVYEKVLNNIIKEMSLEIMNIFRPYFCCSEVLEGSSQHLEENLHTDYSGFELFKDAVNKFYNLHQSHKNTIKRLQMLFEDNEINMSEEHLYKQMCTLLRSELPANYMTVIYQFYRTALRVIMKVSYDFAEKNVYKCTGCSFKTNYCKCDYILNILSVTNEQLNTIGFFKSLVVNVIIELLNKVIQTEVKLTIKLNIEYQQLFSLEKWLGCKVYNWIKGMFQQKLSPTAIIDNSSLNIIMSRLKQLLFKSFLETRIHQLYDIILKYPYSKSVVIDLAMLLGEIKLEPELYKIFKKNLQSRLLQPSMGTMDIIRIYMTAIRVLKTIDCTGLLLEEVTQLIREYLENRMDTIRCIIIILTVNNRNLINDLKHTDFTLNKWERFLDSFLSFKYEPLKKINESEVATILISIVKSPIVFETEYRVLLADRLLAKSTELGDEMYVLNLLKSIFSDSLFQSCDVMIKDLFESAYVNIHVFSRQSVCNSITEYQYSVKALIMSEYYWPKFKNNANVKLPKVIKAHFDFYKKCFEMYKRKQTLIWKPNVGQITMDIILNNEVLSFTVNPIHATIIWHFQKQVEWTIENLSKKINVPTATLSCYITFWINQGLLIRNTLQSLDTFTLVKKLPKRLSIDINECTGHDYSYRDDGTTESAIVSTQEQREGELQKFWIHIEKIFIKQPLNCISINEIEKYFKMFVTQEPEPDMNTYLKDLKILLDNKVKEQRLTFSDGLYTLVE